ncbi:hypothetical protein [Haloferula sp. BvORR071]|uniref:hypothetical protein n=1 Tax=Haloferula sp. BvORR071 TaxID=1396141 RepID=UPI00054D702B|nr:hypothetical protein [Haloferula sp. BvORR071]
MELSPHLHSTRDLLMRSLPAHNSEQAPPMPEGLVNDLLSRFAPPTVIVTRPESFFSKLRNFVATPGFGIAATAVVLLGVGMPILSKSREPFRGNVPVQSDESVGICFVGRNLELQSAIEKSGSFDVSAFRSATTREAANAMSGAKVVVDFGDDTITAYDSAGGVKYKAKLPDDPVRVASAVADVVSRLE